MAADSPTPGTETCCKPGDLTCREWRTCPRFRFLPAPSPVDTTEPPAEMQQESVQPRAHRDAAGVLWVPVEVDPVWVRIAARPSADTETLLASVLRKLIADKHVFLALSTHRSGSGMPVQFTLDDTTIGITDAEADAVKREAGW